MPYLRLTALIITLLSFAPLRAAVEISPGFSGGWYDPGHTGEGYLLQVISEKTAVVYWFTNDAEGKQQWITGSGEISGSRISFTNRVAPVGVNRPDFTVTGLQTKRPNDDSP